LCERKAGGDIQDHPGAERASEGYACRAGRAHGREGSVAGGGLFPRVGHHRVQALVAVGTQAASQAEPWKLTVRVRPLSGDCRQCADTRRVAGCGGGRRWQDHQGAACDGDFSDQPGRPGDHKTPGGQFGQPRLVGTVTVPGWARVTVSCPQAAGPHGPWVASAANAALAESSGDRSVATSAHRTSPVSGSEGRQRPA
jgi:hypothetical protein